MATPFISTGHSVIQNENSATRRVLVEKEETIATKWRRSKLLEGLYGTVNPSIAQLLESQASQLLNDPSAYRRTYNVPVGISSRGYGSTYEESFYSNLKSFFVSLWRKIFKKKDKPFVYDIVADPGFPSILPIATRVAARTISLDLVSVQPLSLPTGLLTYLDYKYEEPENVYTRVVIIEKHKPITYTSPIFRDEDYYIPVRRNVLI